MENLSRYGRLLWIRKIRHHTNGVSDIKENIQRNLKKNPNHYVKQQYLPDGLEGSTFYRPSENGYEKKIGEWLHFLRGSE